MSRKYSLHPDRREFLGQVVSAGGALAASSSFVPLAASASDRTPPVNETWDLSWVGHLSNAKYRAVIDVTTMNTPAMNHAATFLDQFHEVYGTADDHTCSVLVMRQSGVALGFNDRIWERYPVGEDTKIDDPKTKAPARSNPFWPKHDATWKYSDDSLQRLVERGTIIVVCNIAATNWSRRMAEIVKRDPVEVFADFKDNLIAGAVLVPSGVFALIRAQNAGAAYMRG